MSRRLSFRAAFTLVELIVVVIVLGILMGIAIPSFLGASNGATDTAAKSNLVLTLKQVKMIATANHGVLPADASTLTDQLQAAEPELQFVPAPVTAATGTKSVYVERTGGPDGVKLGARGAKDILVLSAAVPAYIPIWSTADSVSGPTSSSDPSISGTPVAGSVLTGSAGDWPGGTKFDYQWQNSSDGTTWLSATGSGTTSLHYTVAASDELLRMSVTATHGGGTTVKSSDPVAVTPTNTALPALSGSALEGHTLTTNGGSWGGATPTFSYQWYECDPSAPATCAAISGATAATYAVQAADGGFLIRSGVAASNLGGTAANVLSTPTGQVVVLPVSTGNPSIAGTLAEGQTLAAEHGTWNAGYGSLSYSYQWKASADGSNWTDATGAGADTASYTVASADVDGTLRLDVTATNAAGSAHASSPVTDTISANVPVNTALPAVSGNELEGRTLTSTHGSWTTSGVGALSYSFQWYDCLPNASATCTPIDGATDATYVLQAADGGYLIRSGVAASNPKAASVVVLSAPTDQVIAKPVDNTPPTIIGTLGEGSTVEGAHGSWDGGYDSLSYGVQWRRSADNGSSWTDATGPGASTLNYTIVAGDVGDKLELVVSAQNAAGTVTAVSATTATVLAAAPVNTAVPAVTGSALEAATLTSTHGSWTSATTPDYRYQWYQCLVADPTTCAPISGATDATYVVQHADGGTVIRSGVAASNPDSAAGIVLSDPTSTVVVLPANSAAPTNTGGVVEGATRSGGHGSWDDGSGTLSYAYQWQHATSSGSSWTSASGTGDTTLTYTIDASDVGQILRLKVTALNAAGSVVAFSSESGTVTAAAPVNTALPAISGNALEGSTLHTSNGGWTSSGSRDYAYQWYRALPSDPSNRMAIAGAKDADYTVQNADGGYQLSAAVAASVGDAATTVFSALTDAVIALPVSTGAPSFAGTLAEGAALVGDRGNWDSGYGSVSYDYQWKNSSNGSNWANATGDGATTLSYTANASDVGDTLELVVTATNAAGATTATSAMSGTVKAIAPVNHALPAVTGSAVEGSTLTTTHGSWTSSGGTLTYTYQWYTCLASAPMTCAAISGATDTTYVVQNVDGGKLIRSGVAASNPDAAAVVVMSDPTGQVVVLPTLTGSPSISDSGPGTVGSPIIGDTLSATTGSWDSGSGTLTYSYQWRRSGTAIPGATGASYTLGSNDPGTTITVTVTAGNAAGSASATPAGGASLAGIPTNNSAPSAPSGSLLVGQQLTAATGSWTDSPTSYSYQWQHNNGSWADIPGATSATYTIVDADVGDTLRVKVAATNGGGTSAPVASAVTGAAAYPAPTNSALPVISVAGAAQVGVALSSSDGTWSGGGTLTYSYQWLSCTSATNLGSCSNVGTNVASYTPVVGDTGNFIRITVTASNGATATATATATASVIPATYLLTVNEVGRGTVSSSPTGIYCSGGAGTCTQTTSGTVVLSAIPATGWTFSGWSGEGCSGTQTCSVALSAARTVTATFALGMLAQMGGSQTACAVTGGNVKCWGRNNVGQMGNGTTSMSSTGTPQFVLSTGTSQSVPANRLTGAAQVATAESGSSCALLTSGEVKCWGINNYGQLGNGVLGSEYNNPVFVLASGATQSTNHLSNVIQISVGSNVSCALISDGTVKCWGTDSGGRLGDGATSGNRSNPVAVSGLTGATSVAVSDSDACALISDGTVKCWGTDGYGELGNNTVGVNSATPVAVQGLTNKVAAIAAGANENCVVLVGGTVECWGLGVNSTIGDGYALSRSVATTAALLTNVVSVSPGFDHVCALSWTGAGNGGAIWCWGSDGSGQFGDGGGVTRSIPTVFTVWSGATQLAVGQDVTFTVSAGPVVKFSGTGAGGGQVTPTVVTGLP